SHVNGGRAHYRQGQSETPFQNANGEFETTNVGIGFRRFSSREKMTLWEEPDENKQPKERTRWKTRYFIGFVLLISVFVGITTVVVYYTVFSIGNSDTAKMTGSHSDVTVATKETVPPHQVISTEVFLPTRNFTDVIRSTPTPTEVIQSTPTPNDVIRSTPTLVSRTTQNSWSPGDEYQCHDNYVDICDQLPYNRTTLPVNAVGETTTKVGSLLEYVSGCHSDIDFYLCTKFVPECPSPERYLPRPLCHAFCQEISKDCGDALVRSRGL
ncbi:uncharacterized protein LOC102809582, partial [Saccoglossus kowalevskii]|uniref:Uncharacterized protein LOC102809582 n=1 Tax=Saccoglossus kowalevskii TaxID=10224 RepID=A0ABM0MUK9_SACKO